ncbi:helix-turn-helix domain-containing protein [Bacteroides cellulosilyticus]|uniref:helix-turn-helix domain-containing protein n=1 Tax=Bacteroides cellulosilyticus TaxID=246787 RepID=UPI0035679058
MIAHELVEAFAFSTPVLCAVCCMLMMLMDARTCKRNRQERRLRLYLAFIYLVTALGWLGMVLYVVSPEGYISYHTVFLLTLMLDQVMFYRLVAILTGTGSPRPFNRLHIVVPFVITALSLGCDLLVPAGKQMTAVYSGADPTPGAWSGAVYMLTSVVFIVYNTLYPLLSLRNIRRYGRFVVDYSSDAGRTSLDWLFFMQLLILICVPVPFAGLLLGIDTFASPWFVWLGALPYFAYYIILCYNMLDGNYLIIQPDPANEAATPDKETAIDRRQFERYLRDKKPHLDPKLRITDLATGLNTNRSCLSSFINREYGMNFSRLINRLRLQELERLRLSPRHTEKSNMELVLKAGFGSYRNYLRVKKEEDRKSLLKMF